MISCNGKKIVSKSKFCKSIFSKAIGLMFHKKIYDEGYIFLFDEEKDPVHIALHNFFVFFPIDVLYLNSKKEVVEICENFKPFTFFMPKNNAQYIIELPADTISKNKIQKKDLIMF